MAQVITRWDEWFSKDNLRKDARILLAPPSQCAENAASAFVSHGKRLILDLACGVGRDTFYLEGRGLQVFGVDASFNGLLAARQIKSERSASSELVTADARRLPFSNNSFEGVYCFGLLHEFTGEHRKEIVGEVMDEIARLLSDDGALILAVLAGEPAEGLPAVQLFNRQMFGDATKGLRPIEIKVYDDTGCTGRTDYRVWYGMFEKAEGSDLLRGAATDVTEACAH